MYVCIQPHIITVDNISLVYGNICAHTINNCSHKSALSCLLGLKQHFVMDQTAATQTTAENVIVDGDVLETTFEYKDGLFNRFTHVIVCDMEGAFVRAVPYIYARAIPRLAQTFATVPLEQYSKLAEFAIRDELLQVKSANPELLCSLIDKQDAVIPSLHREMNEYKLLGLLDYSSAHLLTKRLAGFFRSIPVGNYEGRGIFWDPVNYEGEDHPTDRGDDEDYEDYTRRIICGYIKSRSLPMAHLIPMPAERQTMVSELLDELSKHVYTGSLQHAIQRSHYAPMMRGRGNIHSEGLTSLMAEEFRCVKNAESIDNESVFVFNNAQLDSARVSVPSEKAHDNLKYYVGEYLDELDLSRSFITGSAITASIIRTRRDGEYKSDRNTMIDLLYPKVLTSVDPEAMNEIRKDNINLWFIRAVSETEGIATKGNKNVRFTIKSGSDVDIAVDNTVSDEEYRRIAVSHLEVIQRYHPYAKMREVLKPKGDWNYVIYTDDSAYVPVFRQVEMYRSSFRNICTHHVGAVRGAYTSRWSEKPQFYLTASALYTSMTCDTPNYHYFAGRKSNPQDVIVKNMQRGIHTTDWRLTRIIEKYIEMKNIVFSPLPFYEGRNIPYSLFVAAIEYNIVQEKLAATSARIRQQRPQLLPARAFPRRERPVQKALVPAVATVETSNSNGGSSAVAPLNRTWRPVQKGSVPAASTSAPKAAM